MKSYFPCNFLKCLVDIWLETNITQTLLPFVYWMLIVIVHVIHNVFFVIALKVFKISKYFVGK